MDRMTYSRAIFAQAAGAAQTPAIAPNPHASLRAADGPPNSQVSLNHHDLCHNHNHGCERSNSS